MKKQDRTDISAPKTNTVFVVGVRSTVLGAFGSAALAIRAGIKYNQQYPNTKVWYAETEVTADETV